ncbi:MAG TPA: FAD-binding protein [Actinomycetes bacterium]|nr:FAD-binding protein [Actinomycetes bacterium]
MSAEDDHDVDVDVVVAGAGAGGLAAALSAAEAGRSVLVVEARESFRHGCNTAMSTAMVPAGGSRWQAAAGIEDSPQRFLDDVRRKTGGRADPDVALALTRVAPTLVGWLADRCGLPLELVTDFDYPGHSRRRCHTVPDRSGATLHRLLLEAVAGDERIDLLVPRRLVDVTTDPVGTVTGVRLQAPGGAGEEISAAAVVLATNGFGANPELVRRHLPGIADGLYFGGDGSTGDALAVGDRLGADLACLDAYQGHGSVAVPHGVLLTWAAVMHGGVLVNADGARFGDESTGYSEFAGLVLRQPGATAWVVYDERIDSACAAFADYRRCVEAGAIRRADDVDQLAALVGARSAVLGQTLADASAAAVGAAPDRWGRTHWEAPLAPPYLAVKVTGALFHTQGGLRVDQQARVLRAGTPVGGLYAVGGAAVGMSGHGADGYLAGNGLLAALGLGYLAGRHVATEGNP